LVVGTGNKVEDFGVGFFTKWGDGGVDLSPIGDLYKSEVRELALELGILEEIVLQDPTDGLWEDGRTDEDQLQMSYEDLERCMKGEVVGEEKKARYEALRRLNRHKMEPVPVCRMEDWEF
jgi:NAD+ synthase